MLKSIGLFRADSHFKISLQIVSHILAYTSSCINPLLYAFLSENFRKAFRKVSLEDIMFCFISIIYFTVYLGVEFRGKKMQFIKYMYT